MKAGRLVRLADGGAADALPAWEALRALAWARVRGLAADEAGIEVDVEAAVCEEGGFSVVADVSAVAVDLARPGPGACGTPAVSLLLLAAVGTDDVVVVEDGAWRIEGARPKGFAAGAVLLFSGPVDVGLARRAAAAVVFPENTPESGRLEVVGFVLSGVADNVALGRRFEAAVEKMPESGRLDVVVVVVVDEAEDRARVAADDVAEDAVADRANGLTCGSRLGDVFLAAMLLPLGCESVVVAGWRSDRVRPSPVEEDIVGSSGVG